MDICEHRLEKRQAIVNFLYDSLVYF